MLSALRSSGLNATRESSFPHPVYALCSFLTDQRDWFPRRLFKLRRSSLPPGPNTDGTKEGEKHVIMAFSTVSALSSRLFRSADYLSSPAYLYSTHLAPNVQLGRWVLSEGASEAYAGVLSEIITDRGQQRLQAGTSRRTGGGGERDVLREGKC